MKILKISLILTTFAVFVFACAADKANDAAANNTAIVVNNNSAAPTDELAAAQKTFSEKCVGCHKADGTGGVKAIDGREIKVPNFTSERMKKDKDEDWIDAIENGVKDEGMPAFKGKLSDAEIKNLVRYIHRDIQKM